MNALDASGTWELTPLPKEKKAIECKWVYKIKHNVDGLQKAMLKCMALILRRHSTLLPRWEL